MNRLKSIRALYGVSQKELSELLSISTSVYSMKENGQRSFKKNEIDKIIHFFKKKDPTLTYEEIFGLGDENE